LEYRLIHPFDLYELFETVEGPGTLEYLGAINAETPDKVTFRYADVGVLGCGQTLKLKEITYIQTSLVPRISKGE
jgi:hypothetical protein